MNNIIVIHAAILCGCKERLIQYLNIIKESELINNVNYIYICFVGDKNIPLTISDLVDYNYNNNIVLLRLSKNLNDYELPTLNFLYECIRNNNYNVLYLHTKNVGKEINECIEDQIKYMLYFLVYKWKICVNNLLTFDVCGVDLRNEPTTHFSGNFWWSKSSHILKLPKPYDFNDLTKYSNPLNSLRHNQEFWICFKNNNKFLSLWDCNINVYERHLNRYPEYLYKFV